MATCSGPVRHTKTPTFVLPEGTCDCHTHLFGPETIYPFIAESTYIPEICTLEDLEIMHSAIGVSRAVVVQPGPHGMDNRITLDACAARPKTLRGVVVVPSGLPDAELERMNSLGVRGCRLTNAVKGAAGFEHLEALDKQISTWSWHIIVFVKPHELTELEPRLMRLHSPFVVDHIGRLSAREGLHSEGYASLLRLLDTGRCWVKLSAVYRWSEQAFPYADMTPIIQALAAHRPDRMLWASDWPHPNLSRTVPNDGDIVDLIPTWFPDPAVRQQILVDNPASLYNF